MIWQCTIWPTNSITCTTGYQLWLQFLSLLANFCMLLYDLLILSMHAATGSEEVAVLRSQLDSLYQELEMGKEISIQLLKEKIKRCSDQCHTAFHNLRRERRKLLDDITHLQVVKEQLEEKSQGEHVMFISIWNTVYSRGNFDSENFMEMSSYPPEEIFEVFIFVELAVRPHPYLLIAMTSVQSFVVLIFVVARQSVKTTKFAPIENFLL